MPKCPKCGKGLGLLKLSQMQRNILDTVIESYDDIDEAADLIAFDYGLTPGQEEDLAGVLEDLSVVLYSDGGVDLSKGIKHLYVHYLIESAQNDTGFVDYLEDSGYSESNILRSLAALRKKVPVPNLTKDDLLLEIEAAQEEIDKFYSGD